MAFYAWTENGGSVGFSGTYYRKIHIRRTRYERTCKGDGCSRKILKGEKYGGTEWNPYCTACTEKRFEQMANSFVEHAAKIRFQVEQLKQEENKRIEKAIILIREG